MEFSLGGGISPPPFFAVSASLAAILTTEIDLVAASGCQSHESSPLI